MYFKKNTIVEIDGKKYFVDAVGEEYKPYAEIGDWPMQEVFLKEVDDEL